MSDPANEDWDDNDAMSMLSASTASYDPDADYAAAVEAWQAEGRALRARQVVEREKLDGAGPKKRAAFTAAVSFVCSGS